MTEGKTPLGGPIGKLFGRSFGKQLGHGSAWLAVNLARHLGVNPDAALSRACAKFAGRFRRVEQQAAERGIRLEDCSPEELDAMWERAKTSPGAENAL